MKLLYPELIPYNTFFLKTPSQHLVYIEESGNPAGIPVLFLHGGPCSGTKPDHRRFFNPDVYRIVLMDQRGCGLSQPFGLLENNTTADLIADIAQLRQHLAVKKWLLFGGSWGATLALLYAQQYPHHVSGLILRGIFLARQTDLDWFLHDGVRRIYPEAWQRLVASVPCTEPNNVLQALSDGLFGTDEVTKRRVTKAWLAWGAQVALGNDYQPAAEVEHVTEKMVKQVRMELHYALSHYFLSENQILQNCNALQAIPTVIIHGRYDLVCPIESALALHKALPDADYTILPTAGHIAKGDDMIHALVSATDAMAARLA
jgi:proline iminopeptidase